MSLREFLFGFSYVSVGSALIPIAFFLFSRGSSNLRKAVFVFLMASLLCDLGNRLYFFLGYQGYLILNIYTVLEFTILSYVYVIILKSKRIIVVYGIAFLIVFCLCTAFYQPINAFQNVPLVLESLAMITFAHHLLRQHVPRFTNRNFVELFSRLGKRFHLLLFRF